MLSIFVYLLFVIYFTASTILWRINDYHTLHPCWGVFFSPEADLNSCFFAHARRWHTANMCGGAGDGRFWIGSIKILSCMCYIACAKKMWYKKLSRCWQTRATRLAVSQGHQTWYTIRYDRYSNVVPKKCGFWDIRLQKMSWPWNPGQRSPKVTESDTDRSATWLPINVTQ